MGPPQSGSVMSLYMQGSYFSRERDLFQIMQLCEELRVSQEELTLVRRTSARQLQESQEELSLVRRTNMRQLELSTTHIKELEEQLDSQSGEGSSSWGRGKGKGKRRE